MPPKVQWVMGPGGKLVERSRPISRSPSASSAERLTDGLTSFAPAAVRGAKIDKTRKTKNAWDTDIARKRRLNEAHQENVKRARSDSVSSVRSSEAGSRSPSPAPRSPAPRGLSPSSARGQTPDQIKGLDFTTVDAMKKRNASKFEQRELNKKSRMRPDAGETPEEGSTIVQPKSMAEINRERREREETASKEALMPPILKCLPGGAGNNVSMPAEVKAALKELKPENYFELRSPMKNGKMRKMVVRVGDYTAPSGMIVIPQHAMRGFLDVKEQTDLFIKEVSIPVCERVTFEVSGAVSEREEEHRSKLRKLLENYGCLNRDEVLVLDKMRFKVVDLAPEKSVGATPVKAIKFRVKADKRVPEIKVSSAKRAKHSVKEGMVRVVASGAGRLRLCALDANGDKATSRLYVNMGDEKPSMQQYKWGGYPELECDFKGITMFNVLVVGGSCVLHAAVLSVQEVQVPDEEVSLSGHSKAILSYYQKENRVPSPEEVQNRSPGIDITKLTCLEKLLTITADPKQRNCYTPPHADRWGSVLNQTEALRSFPCWLRVSLLLQQKEVSAACLEDLSDSLNTPEGETILIHIFTALASPDLRVQQPAIQILRLFREPREVISID
eukprot:TRINITY_DN23219_c0_g1_i1.p1 TRINITY_DN23219_c0_g1~~TRINITY_DN23219_c0_g1_i1.p1  ORF type:complete len:634 (+),score=125.87 TRINITY_DN23219_c0_g1_i1:60-1904(+)